MAASPKIVYRLNTNQRTDYSTLIQELVIKFSSKSVCDVGGGANPAFPVEFIVEHGIQYTLLDISETELAKAPCEYQKIVQDIEADPFPVDVKFDFIFTRMLAEHLQCGRTFHRNVFSLLKPGGIAVHHFPTLYAVPFVINKITPEKFSASLLDTFLPRKNKNINGKFPAYYDWCLGPTPQMLQMLTDTGFEILEFRGLMGHSYFHRVPILRDIHKEYSKFLVKHPNPYLTSFAQVILQKPAT